MWNLDWVRPDLVPFYTRSISTRYEIIQAFPLRDENTILMGLRWYLKPLRPVNWRSLRINKCFSFLHSFCFKREIFNISTWWNRKLISFIYKHSSIIPLKNNFSALTLINKYFPKSKNFNLCNKTRHSYICHQ